jgi:hypothetical protein
LAAGYTDAVSMMEAVNKDGSIFKENGIISDAAMQQLKTLPETSGRASAAFSELEAARNALLQNENDPVAQ